MNPIFYNLTFRILLPGLLLLIKIPINNAQPWLYDFGSGTASFTTANTASTSFLPSAPSGTSRVRVGTGGGGFAMNNPGITNLGSSTELNATASSSASVNKFSVYGFSSAANSFYIKFTVRFDLGSTGSWYFFEGQDGVSGNYCFSDNTTFTSSCVFSGLRWTFGSSGTLSFSYYKISTWTTISSIILTQGTNYEIELFGNNSLSIINYTYNNCTSQSVAPSTMDLWVNSFLAGDNLSSSLLASSSNIDSWMFYGMNSTGNSANIYLDDIVYSNCIPSTFYSPPSQPANISFSNTTATGYDVAFDLASGNPDGYIVLRKPGTVPVSVPVNGTTYIAGNQIGGEDVVYVGEANHFTETSLYPGKTYYYAIYAYNGSSTCILYNTNSPAGSSKTTTGNSYFTSATSGNLELKGSWGANTDGSGTSPSNFTNADQYFYIKNISSVSIGGAWTISGTNSKLIIGDGANVSEFVIPSSYSFTGTVDVSAGSKLTIGNVNIPTLGNLSANSTIEYSSTSSQNVQATTYFNLILSGSGNKTLTAASQVGNLLSLNSSAIFSMCFDLQVNNLTINSGLLTINPNKKLTVSGTLINSAGSSGLVVKSDATGSGTLITNSTSVQATVERYVPVTNVPAYHYLSSPVANSSISSILDAGLGNYNAFYYDPSLSGSISKKWTRAMPADIMITGKGYILPYSHASVSSKTISFKGILNSGTVSTGISSTAGDWNLIGNPYPAAINASSFITENAINHPAILGTLYFWIDDASNGTGYSGADYASWNGTGFIANGITPNGNIATAQGFFVQSNGGYSSVSFKTSMENSTNTQFFVPAGQIQRLVLGIVDSKKNYNETLIGFMPEATTGFDPVYDGRKLKGNKDLALYSFIENDTNEFAIQGLPPLTDPVSIPLGLDANTGGDYKFILKRNENIKGTGIYLLDLYENKKIDLNRDSVYKFCSAPSILKDRFKLAFYPNDIKINDLISIYTNGHELFVQTIDPSPGMIEISIYNMQAKCVGQQRLLNDNNRIFFHPELPAGLYLIKAVCGRTIQVKKIWIP